MSVNEIKKMESVYILIALGLMMAMLATENILVYRGII